VPPRRNPYASDLLYLRNAINAPFDPLDYAALVQDWFDDTGRRPPKSYDPDAPWEWLQRARKPAVAEFGRWLQEGHRDDCPPETRPVYDVYWGATILPPTTWLTHFSDEAQQVAAEGFRLGQPDYDFARLAVTGEWIAPKAAGWNFAVEALGHDALSIAREFKYGRGAVLFQAAGVRTRHMGDEEWQVIFLGKLVRRVVLLGYDRDDGTWFVEDRNSERLLRTGKYADVAQWVIDHHAQYRKAIVREVKP
jgi:hypothetical protein